jgi:ABC-type antimicrobial peptide transport system permease subunit
MLLPAIRQLVRRLDASLPIASAGSLRGAQAKALTDRRLTMQLLAVFALLAVALAAVGVYGVLAFLVASRAREIGVRMALGARPRAVFAMVLRQGLLPAVLGLGIGSLGAVALARTMAGMLYGVGTTDGVTFAAVAVILLLVTIVACLVPARRAVRMDPLVALRAD